MLTKCSPKESWDPRSCRVSAMKNFKNIAKNFRALINKNCIMRPNQSSKPRWGSSLTSTFKGMGLFCPKTKIVFSKTQCKRQRKLSNRKNKSLKFRIYSAELNKSEMQWWKYFQLTLAYLNGNLCCLFWNKNLNLMFLLQKSLRYFLKYSAFWCQRNSLVGW